MNEHEFRDALRTNMSAVPEPPPMNEGSVLDAARRDRRRRRAMWAGGGSAAAVVAIAVGVAVVVPSGSGDDAPGLNVAADRTSVAVTTTSTAHSSAASTSNTEPSWPDGQTDRTARSGPRYDKGVTLLDELRAALPAGYESPDDLAGVEDRYGGPLTAHQSHYDDTVAGTEVWTYSADLPVAKGDRLGRLYASVTTPGNPATGEGCDLVSWFWGAEGSCSEVLVDGERVGVVTVDHDDTTQFDHWAGYRHEDGTLVYVAQAAFRGGTDFPALDGPPLTTEQLAALATDPRFHLD